MRPAFFPQEIFFYHLFIRFFHTVNYNAYRELMFYKRAYLVHGELYLKQTNNIENWVWLCWSSSQDSNACRTVLPGLEENVIFIVLEQCC